MKETLKNVALEFDAFELGECEMTQFVGGCDCSTSSYKEVGRLEMEYPEDKDGNPDKKYPGTLVWWPY